MLTIEQCRGARGLLGWTQQDLADASGLSKTAINNFEKGHSDIKSESLRAIRMAFESADIEFLDHDGIRKKAESIRVLRGQNAMAELLDDIQNTMQHQRGEILIANVDNNLSGQIPTQKLFDHIELIKKNDIRERILCNEGTRNVLSPNDECRWLSAENARERMPMFLYGTKAAFQLWDQSMIVILDSAEAFNAERKRFEQIWATARTPTKSNTDGRKTG